MNTDSLVWLIFILTMVTLILLSSSSNKKEIKYTLCITGILSIIPIIFCIDSYFLQMKEEVYSIQIKNHHAFIIDNQYNYIIMDKLGQFRVDDKIKRVRNEGRFIKNDWIYSRLDESK